MTEQDRRPIRRVTDAFSLRPGQVYRLHVCDRDADRRVIEIRTEDFYIERPFDPEAGEYRDRNKIHVRKPDQHGGLDLFVLYYITQLGIDFVHRTNQALIKMNKSSLTVGESYTYLENPGQPFSSPRHEIPGYYNWVEEI